MAMELLSFNNTDDAAIMGVGFWILQKLTRGINVEIVKIQDDPIQKANNKSRIIDTASLLTWMSKLLSSSKVHIRGFIIRGLRWSFLSLGNFRIIFKLGI